MLDELQRELQASWKEWLIQLTAILSLSFQLLLLLTGGTRKWHRSLAAVAWVAYNGADYVAGVALGAMAQASIADGGSKLYAVWAPILLLHLGAPDNISAYAVEDAELWLRHALTMILQIFTAAFILFNCASGPLWILLAVFLMVAGSFKYAERILALRAASSSAIVKAVLPLYKFMLFEPYLRLPIKGDPRRHGSQQEQQTSSSAAGGGDDDETQARFFYIVAGESEWNRKVGDGAMDEKSYMAAVAATPSFVTLQDILEASLTDPTLLRASPRLLLHICFGFALFKLYRRRICRLYMYEWRHLKSRYMFFQHMSPFFRRNTTTSNSSAHHAQDVLFVLDIELRFLYDSLYKKSTGTAFTTAGVMFRVFTALLLVLSATVFLPLMGDDLRRESSKVEGARVVTFLLVSAGMIIELYQVARLLLSDWTTVWLVCTHIHLLQASSTPHRRHGHLVRPTYGNWLQRQLVSKLLLMRTTLGLLGGVMYWRHHISQISLLSIVRDDSRPAATAAVCGMRCSLPQRAIEYVSDRRLTDSFRHDTIADVLLLCKRLLDLFVDLNGESSLNNMSSLFSVQGLQSSKYRRWRDAFQIFCVYIASNRSFTDSEAFITSWHVVTLVCEALDDESLETLPVEGSTDQTMDAATKSKIMSKYAMYLLLKKTELLPCHPDIGREVALRGAATLRVCMENARQYIARNRGEVDVIGNNDALFRALIMESASLREVTEQGLSSGGMESIREDLRMVDVECIRERLGMIRVQEEEYDRMRGMSGEGLQDTEERVDSAVMTGLLAGKLLMLGIREREERWGFVWEMWVELLCCMACPNRVNHHLRHLTEGGEFLTHVWLLLGHMGFGTQN